MFMFSDRELGIWFLAMAALCFVVCVLCAFMCHDCTLLVLYIVLATVYTVWCVRSIIVNR